MQSKSMWISQQRTQMANIIVLIALRLYFGLVGCICTDSIFWTSHVAVFLNRNSILIYFRMKGQYDGVFLPSYWFFKSPALIRDRSSSIEGMYVVHFGHLYIWKPKPLKKKKIESIMQTLIAWILESDSEQQLSVYVPHFVLLPFLRSLGQRMQETAITVLILNKIS